MRKGSGQNRRVAGSVGGQRLAGCGGCRWNRQPGGVLGWGRLVSWHGQQARTQRSQAFRTCMLRAGRIAGCVKADARQPRAIGRIRTDHDLNGALHFAVHHRCRDRSCGKDQGKQRCKQARHGVGLAQADAKGKAVARRVGKRVQPPKNQKAPLAMQAGPLAIKPAAIRQQPEPWRFLS